jgi:hypothetical protein
VRIYFKDVGLEKAATGESFPKPVLGCLPCLILRSQSTPKQVKGGQPSMSKLIAEVAKTVRQLHREHKRRKEAEATVVALTTLVVVLTTLLEDERSQAEDLERRLLDAQRDLEMWKDGWRPQAG